MVHEKMTCSTMQSAKQTSFKKEIQMEEEAEDKELAAEAERLKALRESISWKIAVTKGECLPKKMHDISDLLLCIASYPKFSIHVSPHFKKENIKSSHGRL